MSDECQGPWRAAQKQLLPAGPCSYPQQTKAQLTLGPQTQTQRPLCSRAGRHRQRCRTQRKRPRPVMNLTLTLTLDSCGYRVVEPTAQQRNTPRKPRRPAAAGAAGRLPVSVAASASGTAFSISAAATPLCAATCARPTSRSQATTITLLKTRHCCHIAHDLAGTHPWRCTDAGSRSGSLHHCSYAREASRSSQRTPADSGPLIWRA